MIIKVIEMRELSKIEACVLVASVITSIFMAITLL